MAKIRLLRLLALFTILGFSAIGWGIHYLSSDESFAEVFTGAFPVWLQLLIGLGYGLLTGLIALAIVRSAFLKHTRYRFARLISGVKLTAADVALVSVCAGVGEEVLFRGSIQPLLGIWLTSLLFISLHGYISWTDRRLTTYGIYMVVVCNGFGLLQEHVGIFSNMTAHALIDIILLLQLRADARGLRPVMEDEEGEEGEGEGGG